MEYYTKKINRKKSFFLIVFTLFIIFIYILLILFDKKIFPYVVQLGEIKAKTQTIKIINKNSTTILSEEFKYDEIVKIEKDNEGRIVLIQSDNTKLNKIAADMADACNSDLDKMSDEIIPIPIGWLTEKSLFYNIGPKVYVKVQPVGNIMIFYDSRFESAGINQTRHKIYLKVKAKVRMKMPLKSKDIEVNTEVPISDTIIVGQIPEGALYVPSENQ